MKKYFILFVIFNIIQSVFAVGYSPINNRQLDNRNNALRMQMTKYYCKYCGALFHSPKDLAKPCMLNPFKGNHSLFKGNVEVGAKYVCKRCGLSFSTLSQLVNGICQPINNKEITKSTNMEELFQMAKEVASQHYGHQKLTNQKHIPFEGLIKRTNQKFICEKCYTQFDSMRALLMHPCQKSGYCVPLENIN